MKKANDPRANQERQLQAFFANFPNDAKSWANATDEVRDAVHTIRTLHNEFRDENIESMNWIAFRSPSAWNTEGKKEFWRIWNLTTDEVRDAAFERINGWGF